MTEELKQAAQQSRKHATVLSDGEVRHYATCCVTTEDAIRAAEQKVLERALAAAQPAQATPEPVGEPVEIVDLPRGHLVIGKLGDICSIRATDVRRGDILYTRPAPVVPEGFDINPGADGVLYVSNDRIGFTVLNDEEKSLAGRLLYSLAGAVLTAAQAKGGSDA